MNRVEEVGLDQQVQAVNQVTMAGVSILPENDLVEVFDLLRTCSPLRGGKLG